MSGAISGGDLWKRIKGPASALLATLRRIGWSWPGPRAFRTSTGRLLHLTEVAPYTVRGVAKREFEIIEMHIVDNTGDEVQ